MAPPGVIGSTVAGMSPSRLMVTAIPLVPNDRRRSQGRGGNRFPSDVLLLDG
jgi:hypothetical protein